MLFCLMTPRNSRLSIPILTEFVEQVRAIIDNEFVAFIDEVMFRSNKQPTTGQALSHS